MTTRKRITAMFYISASGVEPVREWLLAMGRKDRRAVGTDIKTVEFGWPIGMPVCRPLSSGLYEVRTTFQDGRIARVLFTIRKSAMVLLHGFIKKTRTTPKRDLLLATKRKNEVFNG